MDSRRARMKAVRLLEYGEQLVFNDVPTPTIARDEILVKVKSTAVNHIDLVKASGTVRQILPIDLPWIPGHEFSGVVDQTSRPCTRSGMRPRPGRTSPGTCQWFMGCRPMGREPQDAGHTARLCFVWPRHLRRGIAASVQLVGHECVHCRRPRAVRFVCEWPVARYSRSFLFCRENLPGPVV